MQCSANRDMEMLAVLSGRVGTCSSSNCKDDLQICDPTKRLYIDKSRQNQLILISISDLTDNVRGRG